VKTGQAPATHPCAVTLPGGAPCPKLIPLDMLMDPPHWRLVPRALQREVYRTWGRGTFPHGAIPYTAARRAAVEAAEAVLLAQASRPRPVPR
jgi:hypothetical protein